MSRITRWINLFRLRALARDIDEEIQFHLDERVQRNRAAGMNPIDAEAHARARFGDLEQIKARMRQARVVRRDVASALAVSMALLAGGVYWGTVERVYEVGGGVAAPVPFMMPKPEYTPAAKRAKIRGTVRVRCVVQTAGMCSEVTVIRSLDRTFGLDDEAVRAVRGWRFRPAVLEGVPVASRIMVDLTFALK